jgi:hypothetical protein
MLLGSAVVLGASSEAFAQAAAGAPSGPRTPPSVGFLEQMKDAQIKAGVVTPRTADGKPDLNGYWAGTPGVGGPRFEGSWEPDQVVMQRGYGWNKPPYKPEHWQKVRSLDFSKVGVDPSFGCGRAGAPRVLAPQKIVQTPTEFILYHTVLDAIRFIPADGRAISPSDADQSTYYGVSNARWEGDTLVVDSVGFTDNTWLAWQGYFHSNRMKLTERFRREGNHLYYNFIVEDPDVLVEPWKSDTFVRVLDTHPLQRVEEIPPCTPDEPFGDLNMRG